MINARLGNLLLSEKNGNKSVGTNEIYCRCAVRLARNSSKPQINRLQERFRHNGGVVVGNLPFTTFVVVNVGVSGLDLVTLKEKKMYS